MIQFRRQQRTLSQPVTIGGAGYWTGEYVDVTLRPAAVGVGRVFRLAGQGVHVKACTENVREIPRRTKLVEGSHSVEMVEHVLAALAGMQVDNCVIEVTGSEMPAFDGSCLTVVDAINSVGIVTEEALYPSLKIEHTIRVGDDDQWIEAQPTSDTGLSIAYQLDYGPGPIGCQDFEIVVTPDSFLSEIAAARTFLLKSEADWLQQQGLGANVAFGDLLVFDENGPIQNNVRFDNECVRHKILDIVGDLSLAGIDLNARIDARKSGHRHNTELALRLFRQFQVEVVSMCDSKNDPIPTPGKKPAALSGRGA